MLTTTPMEQNEIHFYPALPIELRPGQDDGTRLQTNVTLLHVPLEPYVGLEPTTFSMARRYATNCINRTFHKV